MGQFLKLLTVFFFAFALEVRVKAVSVDSKKKSDSECFLTPGCSKKIEKAMAFKASQSEVFQFKGGTLFQASSKRESHLISGGILTEDLKETYVFRFLHGSVEIGFGDALLVVDENSRATVTNLNGDVTLRLRDGTSLAIPVGFEIWVDGITTQGKNLIGTLQPVQLDLKFEQFVISKKKQKEWTDSQGNLAARAAAIYQASVAREIASVKAESAAKRAQKDLEQEMKMRRRQEILQKAFSR